MGARYTRRMRALACLALASLAACAPAAVTTAPVTPAVTTPAARGDGTDDVLRAAGIDPSRLRCNRENRWGTSLRPDSQAGADDLLAAAAPQLAPGADKDALRKKFQKLLFWRMVRAVLIEGDNNNLGAFPLAGRTYTGADGKPHPVVVFRSGVTPAPDAPDSCFRSLLEAGGVRHVVNLFDGDIPVADLVTAESRTATAAGASYRTASDADADGGGGGYGPWRELLRSHADDPAARRRAEEGVARLIREQILLPGGAPPRGNIHIHCGGGMHRSGMIAGVVERCVNKTPIAEVEAHYRYHVAWLDPAHPGGAEEGNLRFIREFDCSLLDDAKK